MSYLLGADPEFQFMSDDSLIAANDILEDYDYKEMFGGA